MARKKGLGKGLAALIPKEATIENLIDKNDDKDALDQKDLQGQRVENIDIDLIMPNRSNPRKKFDQEALEELAESIKLYGIIQPIVLVQDGDKYEIVAGERRYRAAKLADLKEVPAIIKDLDDKSKDMISMVENIQRKDLNPYEEALAYDNIMKEYRLTQSQLSEVVGKSRTFIANTVRLLSLDDMTIAELEKGNITSTQARALLGVANIIERNKYLKMLINKEISVNEVEKRVSRSKKPENQEEDIYIRDVQDRLSETLGAKVKLNKGKKSWKLNIEFYDQAQIEDFLENYGIND
ncbi:MAG: ParB/RepB/Spo0J family partition protein [Tissierellia bacterium]|nr:ParB/RepB/Spo0J family partition protein [Tissierellia bacterium]